MSNQLDFAKLLQAYRSIWKNRVLASEEGNEGEVLKEAILRELKDENSHPRVRRSPQEKFISAIKRIVDASSLNDEEKVELIRIYFQYLEENKKI